VIDQPAAPGPVWISRVLLDGIHHELIEQYGGSHGVINNSLVDSALARPQNLLAYVPDSDLAALAASLCFGLAKNHGFRDGNKRTAFTAMAVFLHLNGLQLTAPEPEAVTVMVYLATGVWSEERMAEWIREHMVPLE
jgi:death-on-curing protein